METVFVAVVVSVLSPCVLAVVMRLLNRSEKREDWARQDAVAAQAAEVAALLLAQQQATTAETRQASERLLAANERVAEATSEQSDKLDVIHGLVNSQMTAAIQSELAATERDLSSLREIVELNKAAGRAPSPQALADIAATVSRIEELKIKVEDREEADRIARAQQVVLLMPPETKATLRPDLNTDENG